MILFDYIVYIWCSIYKRGKKNREDNDFYIYGTVVGSISFSLFIMSIMALIDTIFHLRSFSPMNMALLTFVPLFFFCIRYFKYITFEQIETKIKSLSNISILALKAFIAIYHMMIFGFFIAGMFFNPNVK